MLPSSSFSRLGTIARDCLVSGQRGRVFAVFSKVIYLLTENDELFWIATTDSFMHRRCSQISSPDRKTSLPGLSAGLPFHVADHHLIVDPGFQIEKGNPTLWSAPRVTRILDAFSLSASTFSFFSHPFFLQAKGFGKFIPLILSLFKNESTKLEFADPILKISQPLVLDAARACLDRQPARLPNIADKLIGLGTGLTPSGDDFLGGLLFGVHHLQAAYPDLDFTDYQLQIEVYRPRTPFISFALLKDHASGHAIEPLHHIVNGIFSGEPFESISASVSRLTKIGHSTGWDLLTGLLTGLLITPTSLRTPVA